MTAPIPTPGARTLCCDCDVALNPIEREYYGNRCEACEMALHRQMQDDPFDSAEATAADDLATLREQLAKVEAERDEARSDLGHLSIALTGLTAGGSEFFSRRGEAFIADAKACVDHIRARRQSQHDLVMKAMREAAAAEARAKAAEAEVVQLRETLKEEREAHALSARERNLFATKAKAAEAETARMREALAERGERPSEATTEHR